MPTDNSSDLLWPKLLVAQVDDLMQVSGVGEQRARLIREGLSRVAEPSMLDRYASS